MILNLLILLPAIAGLAAYLAGRKSAAAGRWIALVATLAQFLLVVGLWIRHAPGTALENRGDWLLSQRTEWIPDLGISWFVALDGLSMLLVVLTAFVGLLAVIISWREIHSRAGLYYGFLLWILTGINGVFLSLDLFLFYFFWEVMLVPMYFLIGIYGHGRRVYAAVKFFIFTLASGMLMLLAILGLYYVHGQATGNYTFDYTQLLGTVITPRTEWWLMLGFLVAFAVKLPAVGVHSWLPDAHSEAPTAGSLILAGLLLKTGAYGLIRFVVPLFPNASEAFAGTAMLIGIIGIIYGAVLAFAQTDLKRLVAYTSVSHMGFVLLGVYSWNELALQGTVIQLICHGISTGALFILAGMVYERIHTRDLDQMGGLWTCAPRMGAMAMVFAMASLGLPGLGNFVGEFLILFGTYKVNALAAVMGAIGVVFATVYSLFIMQRAFLGKKPSGLKMPDLNLRETLTMAILVAVIVWLGLYPRPVIDAARPALERLRPSIAIEAPAAAQEEHHLEGGVR